MKYTTDHLTTWSLALMANCGDPDHGDGNLVPEPSPGAIWLRDVSQSAAETWGNAAEAFEPGELWDWERECADLLHEEADSAVPTYTHNKWQVFVDLAAYQEDPSELGFSDGDMDQSASACLYMIAERLIWAVWEDAAALLAEAQEANQ